MSFCITRKLCRSRRVILNFCKTRCYDHTCVLLVGLDLYGLHPNIPKTDTQSTHVIPSIQHALEVDVENGAHIPTFPRLTLNPLMSFRPSSTLWRWMLRMVHIFQHSLDLDLRKQMRPLVESRYLDVSHSLHSKNRIVKSLWESQEWWTEPQEHDCRPS